MTFFPDAPSDIFDSFFRNDSGNSAIQCDIAGKSIIDSGYVFQCSGDSGMHWNDCLSNQVDEGDILV